MESQVQRPHSNTYDDPQSASAMHSVVEDESEHQEKKSVLKKVKAKAKKIKDALKNHGHGHEHEHEQDYHPESRDEDEEGDEDEDEDEEMVEDPEIHGAPVYESTAMRSSVPSQGINLEKPTTIGEDRHGYMSSDQGAARPGVQGQEQYAGQPGINLERPAAPGIAHALEDKNASFPTDIHVTRPSFTDKNLEKLHEQGARIGELKEDPNYPRPGTTLISNYETKVSDPTGKGAEEAQMTPLILSLDKMCVSDESVPKPERKWERAGYTGSHDQFAPQPSPTAEDFAPEPRTTCSGQGDNELTPKSYEPSKPEALHQDTLTGKTPDQSGYIEKISTATSAIADKAISAKNVVASKLGYGSTEGARGQDVGEGKERVKSASPTEYAQKMAATVTGKLTPVYERVANAGSSVISKVKPSTVPGQNQRPDIRRVGEDKVASDKGVSVKEYLSEKLKPSDEDKALSEVISETFHKKKEETGKTEESKPMGKVTESEEVARSLGTERQREGADATAAGSESTGKGVVDRIKDAVNLWVAKGGQDHHPEGIEGSPGSLGSDRRPGAGEVEERRLQESVN